MGGYDPILAYVNRDMSERLRKMEEEDRERCSQCSGEDCCCCEYYIERELSESREYQYFDRY